MFSEAALEDAPTDLVLKNLTRRENKESGLKRGVRKWKVIMNNCYCEWFLKTMFTKCFKGPNKPNNLILEMKMDEIET